MILYDGKILNEGVPRGLYAKLEQDIKKTLEKNVLNPKCVIDACDKLAQQIEGGKYNEVIEGLLSEQNVLPSQIQMVTNLLKKENLNYKLKTELGTSGKKRKRSYFPLGVLFHIAAGNVEGLPFYSVIEGLLTGNINILKLPEKDQGISIRLLYDLIEFEPKLKEYIYVFDTPSTNTTQMMNMANLSDAVVVWGGDYAIQAVRNVVKPNKKIIDWGHKISFAYFTKYNIKEQETSMLALANHMMTTNQVLCSSCQGIYLDTNQMEDIYDFCRRFLRIMEQVRIDYKLPDIKIHGEITLQLYNQELDSITKEKKVFKGEGCSIIGMKNQALITSYMFGNCWVKPLPRNNIIRTLFPYRGYLQTAGLSCEVSEWEELRTKIALAGVTRITQVGKMSDMIPGEAHDGEYPLRRYTRIVEEQENIVLE